MSRINTNIPSLVAARVLSRNSDLLSLSLERLSTGLRINSGADDPAGLIASESLRSEAKALTASIENANRASTVVSTAEGALGEVSSLLLELEDLVDRSANEAGLSPDEVAANQQQIDSILSSINRIASTTQFKGIKLLDGSLSYTTSGVNSTNLTSVQIQSAKFADGASKTIVVEVTGSAETGRLIFNQAGLSANKNATISVTGRYGSDIFSFAGSSTNAQIAAAINQSSDLTGVSATASSDNKLYFNSTDYGSNAFVSVNATLGTFAVQNAAGSTIDKDYGDDAAVLINGASASVDGLKASVRTSTFAATLQLSASFGTAAGTTSFAVVDGGANFAISPNLTLAGRESLGLDSVAAGSLGNGSAGYLSSLASGQSNALSTKNFATAQRVVRAAIDQVSSLRGRIGAFQKNTIETTVNSLNVALENIQAADSAIRDTDFASETSKLTRSQILLAVAQQTLQIANQAPQSILSLLR